MKEGGVSAALNFLRDHLEHDPDAPTHFAGYGGEIGARRRPQHIWQLIWRGYAAVVGGIIIVAIWATDRGGGAVVARSAVISTRGGGANRGSTDSGSTDADRHSWAYTTVVATTVNAAAVGTTAIDTSAICRGVSCNGPGQPDPDDSGCSK